MKVHRRQKQLFRSPWSVAIASLVKSRLKIFT